MENKRKKSVFNKILIILLGLSLLVGGLVIILATTNSQINTIAKTGDNLKQSYAEETTNTNTWDISENGDGSVMATLDENGLLTIAGSGKMKDSLYESSVPWYSVRFQIKNVKIENGVTSIENYAFYYSTGLTNIEIPESVTTIGSSAFNGCTSLTNIKVDANNERYCDVNGILYTKDKKKIIRYPEGKIETTYTIINGVTGIEMDAFEHCINLTSIEIPSSVTSIGDSAFYDCSSLTSIEIPSSVTSIPNYAFASCTSLTRIGISENVVSIGSDAFNNCKSLTNIEVDSNNENYSDEEGVLYTKDKKEIIKYPAGKMEATYTIINGVTRIGYSAFSNSKSLKNIEIPSSVTSIACGAFSSCTSLTNIEIPSSVVNIEDRAFMNCQVTEYVGMTNNIIELPELLKRVLNELDILYSSEEFTLTNCIIEDGKVKIFEGKEYGTIKINGGALNGLIYLITNNGWDVSKNEDGSVLATLDENGLLTIAGSGEIKDWSLDGSVPWYAVRNQIKNVKIENGVTSIGKYTFHSCISLTNEEIPESVKSIGDNAFKDCTNLTSIEIPANVTNIGSGAFEGCTSLRSIEIPASITRIRSGVFRSCTSLTSIEIPSNVKIIDGFAFSNCKSLTSIEVDVNNENYCDENGVLYTKDKKKIIKYPAGKMEATYTIVNGVTSIGSRAFSDCKSLTNIEILESVTSIGSLAFSYCTSLTSIEIPNGVKSIGSQAFSSCRVLRSIEIPSSVTSIGNGAFQYCTSLTNIKIRSTQSKNTIEKIEKMNNSYEMTDKEGNAISNKTDTVKTGNRLKIDLGNICTVIVIGDSTGDGEADIKDILAINKHRLNKAELVDEYLIAGDVNKDGTVDIKDILQINKFRLGKVTEI